ncbi:MAG: hypothetical protein R3E68_08380 [Burkholderiaceae bacterium]
MLRSGSRKNYAQWSNADYDATLDRLLQDSERATRLARFEQLERLILKDTPIIPINHLASHFALGRRIERVVTSHAAVIAAADVRFR